MSWVKKIRIGIGYGNIGRGVENAITERGYALGRFHSQKSRINGSQTENVKVYSVDEASNMVNEIDVMVLCGGSATDLPVQSPHFAKMFNIVDSYDNHSQYLGTSKQLTTLQRKAAK